jgi:dTDP-4-amino-4,6-dideoxygalactose transaminase
MAARLASLVNCGRKEPEAAAGFAGRMLGHNYRLTEFQAAILSVQLERLDEQTGHRARMLRRFEDRIAEVAGVTPLPGDSRNDRRAVYQVVCRYDPAAFAGRPRERVLEAVRAEGIPCEGDFYVPVYRSELFPMDPKTNPLAFCAYADGYDPAGFSCPVTERAAADEAIWLPHRIFLGGDGEIDDVVRAFSKVQAHAEEL